MSRAKNGSRYEKSVVKNVGIPSSSREFSTFIIIITSIALIDKQDTNNYNMGMERNKTKTWIIIFAVLLILSIAVFFLLRLTGSEGTVANIYVDGELYEKIDLDAVVVVYDMEIETQFGYNKIHVEHGGISVTDSDCRDHICMEQGVIDNEAVPIVCLPHRLVIEIEGDDIDG